MQHKPRRAFQIRIPGQFAQRSSSGAFVKDPRVSTHQASRVSISSAHNIAGEADGEILGDNKFEIGLFSQKLNVIYNPVNYLK